MFEPQKLITVALAAVLLAPFGFLFWRFAIYQPSTEAEVRARIESLVRERPKEIATTQADGSIVATDTFVQVESIGFSEGTMSWLSFFPRRWVGVVGLLAVAVIFACLVVSLFFHSGTEVTVSPGATPSPATDTQR